MGNKYPDRHVVHDQDGKSPNVILLGMAQVLPPKDMLSYLDSKVCEERAAASGKGGWDSLSVL